MEGGEADGGEVEGDPAAIQRAKDLEVQAVRATEEGSLGDALELLHRAVTEAPNYASPYSTGITEWLSGVVRVHVVIPILRGQNRYRDIGVWVWLCVCDWGTKWLKHSSVV